MPINRTRVSRRDALKASAIFAAPFIAKYARAAGPMAGKRMGYSMSFATIEWLVTQRRGVEEAAKAAGFDLVFADARDNPGSPIAGMPILEVDRAKSVVVLKRGQGKGFSGLENPLFFKDVTGMLYGDAKASLIKLAGAVQNA